MRILFLIFLIFSMAFCEQNNTKPSLKRMIGQMVVAGFDGYSADSKEFKQLLKDLSYGRIGGVILLEKNYESKEQFSSIIKKLRLISTTLPPLIGIDEKATYKLNSNYIGYDLLENLALNSKPVKTLYTNIAKEISEYTINLTLSPDVGSSKSSNLKNDIISAYANDFIDIFGKQNIISAMKFFPGKENRENFDYKELKVYFDMISRNKADIIISSSAKFTSLDAKNEAFFSKIILNIILRNDLKFDGIIMSDDLSNTENIAQSAIKAVMAGNDMVFISSNLSGSKSLPNDIVNAVNKAVSDGKISKEQIESSYNRIQKLKEKLK